MGGLLRGPSWRGRSRTARRTAERPADVQAAPPDDPQPAPDDARGLCIADSVCGLFAEIKSPAPRS